MTEITYNACQIGISVRFQWILPQLRILNAKVHSNSNMEQKPRFVGGPTPIRSISPLPHECITFREMHLTLELSSSPFLPLAVCGLSVVRTPISLLAPCRRGPHFIFSLVASLEPRSSSSIPTQKRLRRPLMGPRIDETSPEAFWDKLRFWPLETKIERSHITI